MLGEASFPLELHEFAFKVIVPVKLSPVGFYLFFLFKCGKKTGFLLDKYICL